MDERRIAILCAGQIGEALLGGLRCSGRRGAAELRERRGREFARGDA